MNDFFELKPVCRIERKFTAIKNDDNYPDFDERNYDCYENMYTYKYNIETNDPNYELYKTTFIYRSYQLAINMEKDFNIFIKNLNIGINNYKNKNIKLFFSVNLNTPNEINYKNAFLTYIGKKLLTYENTDYSKLFLIAYDMCHIDIVKAIVNEITDFKLPWAFNLRQEIGYDDINSFLCLKFFKIKNRQK